MSFLNLPTKSVTTFSSMPELIEGHYYLLFISHYNQTESGYSLYLNAGTAIIFDSETPPLKASFTIEGGICLQDLISFNNTSSDNTSSWFWNFDDGTISESKNPAPHLFLSVTGSKIFNVTLIVENSIGCQDTALTQITKLQSCFTAVPNALTPNGDGLNDYLFPANVIDATDLEFRIFNRFGQLMFESRDTTHKWDGRVNRQMQPAGTYIWTLGYTDHSGRKMNQTGSIVLIR
jgi:gliding motility-associated-like protein